MALTTNLVAYYKLDGNSNDSVASLNGTDTSMTYVSGKMGQAGSFNGSASKIALPTLNVFGSAARSIQAWVKTTNNGGVFHMGNAAADSMFSLNIGASGVNNGTPDVSTFNGTGVRSPTLVNDGNWHQIVATYNGGTMTSANCLIYVDGVVTASVGGSNQVNNSINANYAIGQWASTGSFYFNGQIDLVGLWAKVLTAGEVSELYNGGADLDYPFTSSLGSFFHFFPS